MDCMSKNITKDNIILNLPTLSPEEAHKEVFNPNKKYNEEMGKRVFDLCAKGRTKAQIAVLLGTTTATLDKWSSTYPEFREYYEAGYDYFKAYWEEWYQNKLTTNQPMNAPAVIFWFCNKLKDDYKQRNDGAGQVNIQINNGDRLSPDERQVRIQELLAKQNEKG